MAQVAAAEGPASESAIEAAVDIRRGRLSAMLRALDVEGAVTRAHGGWVRTDRPWVYDEPRYSRVRAARERDGAAMLEYETTPRCRMAFLRDALDDPDLPPGWSCGRCDTCTGTATVVSPAPPLVAAAAASARAADVILEARRQWPAGLGTPRGKIARDHRALDGRALAQVGDAGWWAHVGATLDAWVVGDDATDPSRPRRLDDETVDGLARVLGRWGWPQGRPTWVTWIPSTRRPGLPEALADRLAALGHMELVAALVRTRSAPAQADMGNSAHACANVHGAWRPSGSLPAGPVLLVDDTWSSGWTMTVVADLLAGAGAGPVYPAVLART